MAMKRKLTKADLERSRADDQRTPTGCASWPRRRRPSSTGRSASRRRGGLETLRDDGVPQHADPLDLDLDHVAVLHRDRRVARVADARRRAGEDQVAGLEGEDARGERDQPADAEDAGPTCCRPGTARRSGAARCAGRCRRRAPTPGRGGRRAGRTCRSPCRASTACRRTGGSAPRRRSRSGSRRRSRARRPRRSAGRGGRSRPRARPRSRRASPRAAARSPRPGRSARSRTCRRAAARRAARMPGLGDVGRVVQAGADDLHGSPARSRLPPHGNQLRRHRPARPAVHALPRAARARRGAGLRVRLDVRLARPLAGVDPAAHARRRPHDDDEARPLRHEPGHARADRARERLRDDARASRAGGW